MIQKESLVSLEDQFITYSPGGHFMGERSPLQPHQILTGDNFEEVLLAGNARHSGDEKF